MIQLLVPSCSKLHSARVTVSPPLDLSVDSTRLANQPSTRSFAASDLNFVSSSSARQFANLLRHSSVCARAVVFVITDLHPGQFHAVTIFLHIGSPDVQPPARCSVHRRRRHHDLRDWCGCWHRNCHICGKWRHLSSLPRARFGFHGVPFNVVRNSKSKRFN